MRKFSSIAAGLALVAAILACNLPSGQQTPAAVLTSAALTVQAQLTANPSGESTATSTPSAESTTAATATLPPTAPPSDTPTPVCDLAQFGKDVNVSDGTKFNPNEHFTKTWRLKNIGACAWSGYNLVFDSGDSMGGASPIPISTVNPGQEVDLSVDLTAPASEGNYRGYWRIRNTSGVLVPVSNGYQGKSFYVDIKVKAILAPPIAQVNLHPIAGESGTVYEPAAGQNIPNTILAGDTGSNYLARGFMSFDISSLNGVNVQSASLDLSHCAKTRDPFGNLNGIWVGEVQYGTTLNQADYNLGGTGIKLLHSIPGGTIDVKSYVQARINQSKSRFQIRLHPNAGSSNGDGLADYMTCSAGNVTLTIVYQ